MSEPRALGIVGCGAIGGALATAVDSGEIDAVLVALCDAEPGKAASLAKKLKHASPEILSIEDLINKVDLVVESAAPGVSAALAEMCPRAGKDLLTMSVGGIREEHFDAFRKAGCHLYIPSGAVCGLDGIQASALGEIRKVQLTTRKPPAGLRDAPGVSEIPDFDNLKEERTVFEGSVDEAIRQFPKNVNVAAAIALASGARDRMRVRVVADPAAKNNVHEILVEGSLGNIRVRVENVPWPENPRTSALAAYSGIATLRKICDAVKIGT